MKLFTTLAIAATAMVITMGAAEARGHRGHRHSHIHGHFHGHGAFARGHGGFGHSHHRGFMFTNTTCVVKHRWKHHHHIAVRYCHPSHL